MKLILVSEVSGLGSAGDVVDVRDGYGNNYLLPRGLAVRATRGAEKQVAQLRRAREVREIRDLDQARAVASELAGLAVRVPASVGKGGRLFGSVTPADVVDAVVAAGGPRLDRRRLEMPASVKSVGTQTVAVRLHPEVSATFPVEVVPG